MARSKPRPRQRARKKRASVLPDSSPRKRAAAGRERSPDAASCLADRIEVTEVGNGLRVVTARLPHLHRVAVSLAIRVGSRFETVATNGISHFVEHMLFRGTRAHPSSFALNHAIETLGGTLEGATYADLTELSVTLPPESWTAALGILAEIVSAPLFEGIETEKAIVREEILEGLDEEGQDIDIEDVSRRLVFGKHPLGFKITGELANVEAFGPGDLVAHMARAYGAANMVLTVAGPVEAAEVEACANAAFAEVVRGTYMEPADAAPLAQKGRSRHVKDPGSQTEVRLCFPIPGRLDPRAPAIWVLGRILDDGLSTRVHRSIVDERGLAYDALAGLDQYEDTGVLDLGATVAHGKVPEVLMALNEIKEELCSTRVSAEELDKAKRRFRWDTIAMLDDAEGLANHLGREAISGLVEGLEPDVARVAALGAEDIRDVAAEIFAAGRMHVACVGSMDKRAKDSARRLLDGTGSLDG